MEREGKQPVDYAALDGEAMEHLRKEVEGLTRFLYWQSIKIQRLESGSFPVDSQFPQPPTLDPQRKLSSEE